MYSGILPALHLQLDLIVCQAEACANKEKTTSKQPSPTNLHWVCYQQAVLNSWEWCYWPWRDTVQRALVTALGTALGSNQFPSPVSLWAGKKRLFCTPHLFTAGLLSLHCCKLLFKGPFLGVLHSACSGVRKRWTSPTQGEWIVKPWERHICGQGQTSRLTKGEGKYISQRQLDSMRYLP